MSVYAYCRVSTYEQNTQRQITNIKNYCKNNNIVISDENIFIDKISGKKYERPEYAVLKRILRSGDIIFLSELDRLGRTKAGIKEELEFIKKKGAKIKCLDIPSTLYDAEGKEQDLIINLVTSILVEVFSTLAQQELVRKEMRQRQGIEEARKRGVYKGRKPIDVDMNKFGDIYERWKLGQLKTIEAKALSGLKNNTFYRTVEKYEREKN